MTDTSIFIELVRARPVLYDMSHQHYKDTTTVKRINWLDVTKEWKDISGEELTIDSAMKRWVNIRDTYVSHKRKYELLLASGAPATDEPKWKWWGVMKWYKDFTKKRVENKDKRTNIGNLPQLAEKAVSRPEPEEVGSSIHMPDEDSSVSSCSTSVSNVQQAVKKKRKVDNQIDVLDTQINDILKSCKDTEDEAYHLFQGWATKYRKFSSYQQAIARREIEAALFKAEFETPVNPQPHTPQPHTSQPHTSQPHTSQPHTSQPHTSQKGTHIISVFQL